MKEKKDPGRPVISETEWKRIEAGEKDWQDENTEWEPRREVWDITPTQHYTETMYKKKKKKKMKRERVLCSMRAEASRFWRRK